MLDCLRAEGLATAAGTRLLILRPGSARGGVDADVWLAFEGVQGAGRVGLAASTRIMRQEKPLRRVSSWIAANEVRP